MERVKGISLSMYDKNFNKRGSLKHLRFYIHHNRKKIVFLTNIAIEEKFFDKKTLSVTSEHENAEEINNQINALYKFYSERFIFLKESGLPITKETFNGAPKVKINSKVKFQNLNGKNFSDIESIDFDFLTLNPISVPKLGSNYVYILINNENIVYVGKTECNLLRRLERHQYDKVFDSFIFFETDPSQTNIIEAILIRKYQPYYNKVRF